MARRKRYIPKFFNKKHDLIDNVAANYYISPFYFILMSTALIYLGRPIWGWSGAFFLSSISTAFYLYASTFLQPDLDVGPMRPGMGYFPFGAWTLRASYGIVFRVIGYPINRFWYYLWHPYSILLTHRGLGHWPIIGTWSRIGYLYFFVWLAGLGLSQNITIAEYVELLKSILGAFFPWSPRFGSLFWFLFCLPVYVADITHFIVDYLDSSRKGITFCPPQIKRGWLIRVVIFVKKMIGK